MNGQPDRQAGGEDILWRVRDRLVRPPFPLIMGVLNATPDSFHGASRVADAVAAVAHAERMLAAGAGMLDIGGASSRPGAATVPEAEEIDRVVPLIEAVHARFPQALISVDTWRAAVAQAAVAAGAAVVNDIGAGLLDPDLLLTVARLGVPYIAMHMQGTPDTMQVAPAYTDVAAEVTRFLFDRAQAARAAGIADVVLDPGIGFGKTTAHNFALLRALPRLKALGAPVLIGLSRKRLINSTLGIQASDALNGTSVLNTIALLNGADILRVHDVREAVECVKLVAAYRATWDVS